MDSNAPPGEADFLCALSRFGVLEVYPSMDVLKEFWYSDGYQAAKKLREGLATVNFIIAIEAD